MTYPRAKRCLDVIGALVFFVLVLPILALVAGLVKLSSPGPIIFRQVRVGLRDQNFTIYKFRTMIQGSEDDAHRTTRVGRVLRILRLDELPQLFNVLKGDMSLVGPRPLMADQLVNSRRVEVRPGITGLAKVRHPNCGPGPDMLALDCEYIRKLGFWTDLKVLFLTPAAVIRGAREARRRRQDLAAAQIKAPA